jgi:hypothetical protein
MVPRTRSESGRGLTVRGFEPLAAHPNTLFTTLLYAALLRCTRHAARVFSIVAAIVLVASFGLGQEQLNAQLRHARL